MRVGWAEFRPIWAIILVCTMIIVSGSFVFAAQPPDVVYSGYAFLDLLVLDSGVHTVEVYGNCDGVGGAELLDSDTLNATGGYTLNIEMDDTGTGVYEGCTEGSSRLDFKVDTLYTYAPDYGNFAVANAGDLVLMDLLTKTPIVLTYPSDGERINDSTPQITWTGPFNDHINYTLRVDTNSGFSSADIEEEDIHAMRREVLDDDSFESDVTYYLELEYFFDGVSIGSTEFDFMVDTEDPLVAYELPAANLSGYGFVNEDTIDFTVKMNEDCDCKYSLTAGRSWASKTLMSGAGTDLHVVEVNLNQGSTTDIYLQCEDTLAHISDEIKYTYTHDVTPPTPGNVVLESGFLYSADSDITIEWNSFNDVGSSIKKYYYDYVNQSGTTNGNLVAAPTVSTSDSGLSDGTYTVYVWAEDDAGNIGDAATSQVIVDVDAPVIYGDRYYPSDLDQLTEGDVYFKVNVLDATVDENNLPRARYKLNNGFFSSWIVMSYVSSGTYNISLNNALSSWNGGDNLTIQVSAEDHYGRVSVDNFSEIIDITTEAPIFTSSLVWTANENTPFAMVIRAEDPDSSDLNFSTTANMTITKTGTKTALLNWTPANEDMGVNNVPIRVSDGTSTTEENFIITVNPINDAPILENIGNLRTYLYQGENYYFYATDPDNNNSNAVDDNIITFGEGFGMNWVDIVSYYNASINKYVGFFNYTSLSSHKGINQLNIYAYDGELYDYEQINLTVGYCGDTDETDAAYCESPYESCESCPVDCGKCEIDAVNRMTILLDNKNCLGDELVFKTYELGERGECENKGAVVGNYEVCNNISSAAVEVFILDDKEWVLHEKYSTNEDGEGSFIASDIGTYKFVAKKSSFEDAVRVADVNYCKFNGFGPIIDNETLSNSTSAINDFNQTFADNNETTKEKDIKEISMLDKEKAVNVDQPRSTMFIMMFYVALPALILILAIVCYFYYDNNKDKAPWLIKLRIKIAEKLKKNK